MSCSLRPATPQSAHRAWTLGHFPSAFETLSEDRADLVESTVWQNRDKTLFDRYLVYLINRETRSLTSRASSTPLEGQVGSCGRPVQIWVQNWVQLAANIPHNGPIFRIESIVNKG